MKSVLVLLSVAAAAFAQRLHIAQPAAMQTLKAGEFFTMEFEQDISSGALQQVTIIVGATQCSTGSVCDQPDHWGPSAVLYNGIYVPKTNSSDGAKGHFQDFRFQMPQFEPGEVVLSVGHRFKAGGTVLADSFDYTTVHVNLQK